MLLPGPDTHVVELRVPGAASPSPESAVGAVAAVDVDGDGVGRLLRPADRLLRPAPGPVLRAAGRPIPRTVEGYCWAAMAPRGAARVVWPLLLPFTLVNAAHWMLPPGGPTRSLRASLRMCGLLLTMMLAAQLTVAGQQLPATRGVPGLLLVVLAVLVAHRLSTVRWPAATGSREQGPDGSGIGAELTGDPDAALLRALHSCGALATVALLAAGGLGDTPLPDPATAVTGIGALLGATTVLTGLLLVPAARAASPRWHQLPRALRPWAGGWAAAPVLALAGLLGSGFGAALGFAVRALGVASSWPLPAWYGPLVAGWAAAGVLLLVAAPVLALRSRRRLRRTGGAAELRALHGGAGVPAAVRAAWRRADTAQRLGHHVVIGVTGAVLLAFGVAAVSGPAAIGPVADGLVAIGAGVLAAVAAVATVAAAAGPPRRRSSPLAVLVELASYWPRAAHPMVPPCPALKVVPELVARAETHLADPGTRVVLTGEGRGSVFATFAAARLVERLAPADRERVGLVTAGSPLQWAYTRAFPAVAGQHAAAALAGALQGRWRALCRVTDPGGSAMTTWSRQVFDGRLLGLGLRSDGTSGALVAARREEYGALVLGAEHWLPDPQRGPTQGRRWRSGLLGAADYPSDPEWDSAVALAAGLPPASAPAANGSAHGHRDAASLGVRSRSGSR